VKKLSLLLIILLVFTSAFAEEANDGKSRIEADSLRQIDKNNFHAQGNVNVFTDDGVLYADEMYYNKVTGELKLFGNVKMTDKEGVVNGDTGVFNKFTNTGVINNSNGFMKPYFYFKAKSLTKLGKESYLLDKTQFTACEGDSPDWSFSASKAKIDVGQYFTSTHTRMNIKKMPILYTPYFVYPIKTKRETGFLVPSFGLSSSKGSFIAPKFFWNIDVDKDLTYSPTLFADAGLMHKGEFRYQISKDESIYIYGEQINEKDTESDRSNRYFLYQDTYLRPTDNLEIYIFNEHVSDYRYVEDFEDFKMSEMNFYENDDNIFQNNIRALLTTDIADITLKYNEETQFKNSGIGYTRTRLVQKPNLTLEKNFASAPVIKTQYKVSYDNVEREEFTVNFKGADTRDVTKYQREHAMLKLYKPLDARAAIITPYFTEYYTKWHNFNKDININKGDVGSLAKLRKNGNNAERYTYLYGVDVELNEIYKEYANFKHSIFNTFGYQQSPYMDESGLPDYIENDRMSAGQVYSYRLRNQFDGSDWMTTVEFIQQYDARVDDEKYYPLETRFRFTKDEFIVYDIKHKQNHYDKTTDLLQHYVKIYHGKNYIESEFYFDRTVEDSENTSFDIGAGYENDIAILGAKYIVSGTNTKLTTGNLYSRELMLSGTYKSDCWHFGVSLKRKYYNTVSSDGDKTGTEDAIMFTITFKGIGEFEI